MLAMLQAAGVSQSALLSCGNFYGASRGTVWVDSWPCDLAVRLMHHKNLGVVTMAVLFLLHRSRAYLLQKRCAHHEQRGPAQVLGVREAIDDLSAGQTHRHCPKQESPLMRHVGRTKTTPYIVLFEVLGACLAYYTRVLPVIGTCV